MIKAIGFDLDGTLVNTHVNYEDLNNACAYVLEPLGIPVKEIWKDSDPTLRDPFYKWLEENGRSDEREKFDSLIDERCLQVEKAGAVGSRIYDGMRVTLEKLKDEGYKLGVVTRGGHEYAVQVLKSYNLIGYFDVIQGRDDYDFLDAKPSPMAMKHLSNAFAVDRANMIYVGDSPTDYFSARDANVQFVGVLTGRCSRNDWKSLGDNIIILDSAADVLSIL